MANNNWSKIVHEVSKTSEFILKKELPYVEPELLTKLLITSQWKQPLD